MHSIIPEGVYKHYKGNLYEVLGLGKHSESLELMVIYKALYGDFTLWIRPLSLFCEEVDVKGTMVKRFEKLLTE